MYVWNYTQIITGGDLNNRGIGAYDIFLDTGSGFGTTAFTSGTLTAAPTTAATHLAQNIALNAQNVVGIRFSGTNLGGSGSGIDEALFRTPEPSSAMLLGLAGLGLIARRRR